MLKVLLVTLALASPAAQASEQFIFSWPLDEKALKPRGATTRGAPVLLDSAPSQAWQRLREPGLSELERDRRAILAMAGPYRVSFDFLEVVRFDPRLKPDAPYEGAQTWARRAVPAEVRRGAWSQSVLQVDDSPRYAALGRWQHAGGVSTWLSEQTWRPLPRREFSVRKDYQVLVGTNRHTITPEGWVQEENNLKLVLEGARHLAREYGVARYQRIRDYDFSAGENYYLRTEPFWAEVRSAWRGIQRRAPRFTLRAPADQAQLFVPFFDYAARLEEGAAFDPEAARAFIRRTLQDSYLAS